jgi:hypothetical protein
MSEIRAWEAQHQRPDPEAFGREILPLLRPVPISRIAQEVEISLRYASLIRRGGVCAAPEVVGEAGSPRPCYDTAEVLGQSFRRTEVAG